ncbi:MAG: hypothetical protein IJ025_03180 [Clostridia bacterium]|nr:hypothetical protein [Clostridia bacterium]
MKKPIALLISIILPAALAVSISVTIFAAYLKTPVITSIANQTEGIKINWDEVYGATGYRVYRRCKGEKWSYLETVTETEYLDRNTENGIYYIYTLRATDGKTRGDYDRNGKSTKRLVNPDSFKAVNKTDGIEVTWSKNPGATGYRVYRRGAGEKLSYLKTVKEPYYFDKTAVSGKTYRYTARAVCGSHISYYSSEGVVTKRLLNPSSIKTANRANGVFVTWGGVKSATAYRVYRRGAGEKWSYLTTVKNKYYLDKTAKKNTVYRYTIRATNGKIYSYFYSDGSVIRFKAPVFKGIINTTYAESYSSLNSNLKKIVALYPDMLKLTSAGTSEAGKDIPMVTMGHGEKNALIVGAIHAREHITTKYILRCIEDYCFAATTASGKIGNYNINKYLDEYTIYIIPCTNPDGLEIVRSRLTPHSSVNVKDLSEYKANYNGVDLNRNFPLAWNKINNGVTRPSEYYFKGYASGDQSETQALMTLCENNSFEFMLSIHIKGNCLYWGDTYNTKYNARYKAFATDIANACGFYMTKPTTNASSYGGGFENWFRHTYNRPGVCVELSDSSNTVKPCNNSNYTDFNGFVNYKYSKYALAAALESKSGD